MQERVETNMRKKNLITQERTIVKVASLYLQIDNYI